MRDGQPVPGLGDGAAAIHPWLRPRLRRVRAQGDGDGAGRSLAALRRARRGAHGAGPGRGVRALSFRQRRGLRLRAALEAAALRRFPVRAQHHPPFARGRGIGRRDIVRGGGMSGGKKQAASAEGYNFAYLDEQTKRMIRRAILKAVAIPGYQVPFGSREMPLPYGWGTGGIQVTASIIGPDDILNVIHQSADDTTTSV